MEPLVAEIIGLIDVGADDPRLRWSPDRTMVRVVLTELDLDSAPTQAGLGRRIRFGDAWRAAMAERGWVATGPPGAFARPASWAAGGQEDTGPGPQDGG
jgi:hypothetical protein